MTTQTTETIQTAQWTPNAEARQRGAKSQTLYVYPDRVTTEKDRSRVVVSKQPNSMYVFSVSPSELS